MRHSKIGWYAAIILAATASAVGVQAAAPPVVDCPEPAPCSLSQDVADNVGQDGEEAPCACRWVEQWQNMIAQQKYAKRTLAAWFREETGTPDFSTKAPRKFTIVFRIQEGTRDRRWWWLPRVPILSGSRGAVRNPGGLYEPAYFVGEPSEIPPETQETDEDINAVVESLQRKLLELHEEGSFEMVIDAQGNDRADVSIHYEPVPPPPPPPSANQPFTPWMGFTR